MSRPITDLILTPKMRWSSGSFWVIWCGMYQQTHPLLVAMYGWTSSYTIAVRNHRLSYGFTVKLQMGHLYHFHGLSTILVHSCNWRLMVLLSHSRNLSHLNQSSQSIIPSMVFQHEPDLNKLTTKYGMVSMFGWSHWSPFEHGWSQRGVVAFSTGRFDCRRPRMLWLPKVLFPHVADVLLHSLFEWFLNLKKCKKKENTWNIKKQTFKTEKNGSKRNGEKKERQKGKNIGTTWTCPFAFF